MIQEGLRGKTVTDELVVMPQMHNSVKSVVNLVCLVAP